MPTLSTANTAAPTCNRIVQRVSIVRPSSTQPSSNEARAPTTLNTSAPTVCYCAPRVISATHSALARIRRFSLQRHLIDFAAAL